MNPKLLEQLTKLRVSRETVSALVPLVARYGAQGAVVLARGYLGPVARQVEQRGGDDATPGEGESQAPPDDENKDPATGGGKDSAGRGRRRKAAVSEDTGDPAKQPPAGEGDQAGKAPAGRFGLKSTEIALLGMAVTKLVYEAGELALHNPKAAADGKQPEFKLDENGSPPAVSLAHVVAATRLWRERSAENAAREEAQRRLEQPAAPSAPRVRLLAARAERYARAPAYSYAAPTANVRVPR